MTRIVIVGNGMVSHRLCDRLIEHRAARRIAGDGALERSEMGGGDPAGSAGGAGGKAPRGIDDIVVCGEEPRPAYDRVHLTEYFAHGSADRLELGSAGWYAERGIDLRVATRVVRIRRADRVVETDRGSELPYDALVLATGSAPMVPPVPGIANAGVFVYRTIEDLDAIRDRCRTARRAAVVGGGLLGLEAARAVLDAGVETHVVELAPRLMPRQLDDAGAALLEAGVRRLGVVVHLGAQIAAIAGDGAGLRVELAGRDALEVDLVIVAAGIRPRDELAREAGIAVGKRGGILVDDAMRTSDPHVFAVGEVALHRGELYGLVAPGYEMADVLARHLTGQPAAFTGIDPSARLKLLGTEVASVGDPFREPADARTIVYDDRVRGRYQKLVVSPDGTRLYGGILVGDTADFARLVQLVRSDRALADGELPALGSAPAAAASSDDVPVCSCNAVSAGAIRSAIHGGAVSAAQIKACTRAGTGCGGCLPAVHALLSAELTRRGAQVKQALCEHFAFTRQELFEIIAARRFRTFAELVAEHGTGLGCEVCKPTVASILASLYNEPILDERHRPLQDSNDRFLANIQRDGTYSVVPRIPAGEVTPDQLIAIGWVAKKYDLYTKITGGQRIDLFGARVEQLPEIWEELIAAGLESGHAYGKAMRTVKSCVGSTWCRFGVQDSTALAIRVEQRYKGVRAPHKLKGAVSGCVRECAEARSKDFGLIATERGWNLYVCGNGGAQPRHAELLVADVDEDTAVRYVDRFVMFYIRTADRLTRTSAWLEKLDGGIDHLRDVIVRDSLGIADDLERQIQSLIESYACEWRGVVEDPVKRAQFRHFANDAAGDRAVTHRQERGQRRPSDPPPVRLPVLQPVVPPARQATLPPGLPHRAAPRHSRFVRVARACDIPAEGGIAVKCGDAQLAIFQLHGAWYATQNACPHSNAMVLARGIVGDEQGTPKVACPLHKRTFDLASGRCLSDDAPAIATYPVRVDNGEVWVELPERVGAQDRELAS